MSRAWQVLAKNATTRPPRKTGVATVMSFSWDAVFQGSFVARTSPGRSVSTGKRVRKWTIPVAIELM